MPYPLPDETTVALRDQIAKDVFVTLLGHCLDRETPIRPEGLAIAAYDYAEALLKTRSYRIALEEDQN